MSLTEGQKKFCSDRTINIGDVKMLPRFGFTAYSSASFGSESFRMNSNPFTKSLDYSPIIVQEEENGFYKVNFADSIGKYVPPFYIKKYEMESRPLFEIVLLRIFLWPFFAVYNLFTKKNKDEV